MNLIYDNNPYAPTSKPRDKYESESESDNTNDANNQDDQLSLDFIDLHINMTKSFRSKYSVQDKERFVQCIQNRMTPTAAARKCDINPSTANTWYHRCLDTGKV